MPGVKIGDGVIIAAKSVVVKNIDPYTIVGGNPARVINKRCSKEIVHKLQKLRWWDLKIETINANIEWLLNDDVETLKRNLKVAINVKQFLQKNVDSHLDRGLIRINRILYIFLLQLTSSNATAYYLSLHRNVFPINLIMCLTRGRII